MTKNIFTIAIIAIFFVFTSCGKDELVIEPQVSTKTDILTFATQEELDKTLSKVNSMSKEERLSWEKKQGFKSFGTICDEFYETINPEQFKSFDEVKEFASKHSDKISLSERYGEFYCEPQKNNVFERYIMNENSMYRIGKTTYYRSADGVFVVDSTSKDLANIQKSIKKSNASSKVSSSFVTEYIVGDTSTIGSDHYRMMFTLSTYNTMMSLTTYVVRQIKLDNYARWLAIWWLRTYNSTYTVKVKGTDLQWGNWFLDGPTETKDVKSVYLLNDAFPCAGGSVNTQPSLTWYNIVATNEKNCSINSSRTF